jgi:DNA-binding CsgD family transcriptional regulator
MELHRLPDSRSSVDSLFAHIGRLIEVVGTTKFEAKMFRILREVINCEHLTAFAFSDKRPPRVLLAANNGDTQVAKLIAQKYIAHYWKMDPANNLMKIPRKDGSSIALRILPDDIADGSYRQDCYTSARLQDRFTLMRPHGEEIYRVNFYGGPRGTRSSGINANRIMESADLLMALLVKHDAVGLPGGDKFAAGLYQNRLRLLEPSMPLRETEVCAAIVRGMTSEAIALELGISVNTVLTYRKRAYARLGISCQNELLRFVLSPSQTAAEQLE